MNYCRGGSMYFRLWVFSAFYLLRKCSELCQICADFFSGNMAKISWGKKSCTTLNLRNFFFFVFPHFGDLKSVSFQSAGELTAHSQISLQGELSTEKSDKKGDPGVLSVDKFWPCMSQDVKFNCFCQPLNIPFSLSSFQPNFRFLLEEESIPELHFSML